MTKVIDYAMKIAFWLGCVIALFGWPSWIAITAMIWLPILVGAAFVIVPISMLAVLAMLWIPLRAIIGVLAWIKK